MQRSDPAVAKFYNSPQWKQVRKAYRLYRHNICERCGGIGYFVHHKEYISSSNIYDPNITLNFNNLELLCKDCHNKEHFAETTFDANGEVVDKCDDIFKLVGILKN